MAEVCEGTPVAVSGWVLTDGHDLRPRAASSLHRETMSVSDAIGGTGRHATPFFFPSLNQASLRATGASIVSSSHALRSSNCAILVSIAAPRPLRPAAGDGRVPGQALIYTSLPDASLFIVVHSCIRPISSGSERLGSSGNDASDPPRVVTLICNVMIGVRR